MYVFMCVMYVPFVLFMYVRFGTPGVGCISSDLVELTESVSMHVALSDSGEDRDRKEMCEKETKGEHVGVALVEWLCLGIGKHDKKNVC